MSRTPPAWLWARMLTIVLLGIVQIHTFIERDKARDELNVTRGLFYQQSDVLAKSVRAEIELKRALVATLRENNSLYATQHELQNELRAR